ncbi:unnamed protein product [Dibothriocephalus latus]|uniref:Uncharacterized protein n=1 Tax=Dibothriocephalus latus TaxID=60516 RepID=A0A3P7MD52_DIBLA|nr:unnamed protein product [Dibothriocephalus latus]
MCVQPRTLAFFPKIKTIEKVSEEDTKAEKRKEYDEKMEEGKEEKEMDDNGKPARAKERRMGNEPEQQEAEDYKE